MKIRHCPECGGEITFLYETPTKSYRIENDTLIRDDNNMTDIPELNPYCSNDKEHNISESDPEYEREFWVWVDNVYMHFIDRGIYER